MRQGSSFDDIIRNKLNQVAPAPGEGEWERFQELLEQDKLSAEEDAAFFDRVVRSKAPRYNEAGLSQNWSSFLVRLDHIYQRERNVLASKILELAALLLFLIVFDRDFNVNTHGSYADAFHSGRQSPERVDPLVNTPPPSALSEIIAAEVAPAEEPVPELTVSGADGVPLPDAYRKPSDHLGVNNLPVQQPGELISPKAKEELAVPLAPLNEEEQLMLLPRRVKSSRAPAHTAPGKIIRLRARPHLSLSMFGSTDLNRIYTPAYEAGARSDFDRTPVQIPAYNRLQMGYSGGAAFAIGLKRLEVETGLLYTAKQYSARPVVYVIGSVQEGYYGEGLKDIEMNIAAVPVNLRYDLYRRNGWRVYAGAGASLQVVLESNYAVADQSAFRNGTFNPSPSDPDGPGVLKSTDLSFKNLDGGWLQGGAFSSNSFLTANGSFGLERRFVSGWGFFVQPTYHHSVFYFSKGLGPDYERLHTLSLFTGVRVRLQ